MENTMKFGGCITKNVCVFLTNTWIIRIIYVRKRRGGINDGTINRIVCVYVWVRGVFRQPAICLKRSSMATSGKLTLEAVPGAAPQYPQWPFLDLRNWAKKKEKKKENGTRRRKKREKNKTGKSVPGAFYTLIPPPLLRVKPAKFTYCRNAPHRRTFCKVRYG